MTPVSPILVGILAALAVCGMTAGVVLAVTGYSSAGPFSVASACVGVIGTLAAEGRVTSGT